MKLHGGGLVLVSAHITTPFTNHDTVSESGQYGLVFPFACQTWWHQL